MSETDGRDTDGRTNTQEANHDPEQAKASEKDRGRSGEATPATGTSSNEQYTSGDYKPAEQSHRTGLRTVENHATWREVYYACDVEVGIDD